MNETCRPASSCPATAIASFAKPSEHRPATFASAVADLPSKDTRRCLARASLSGGPLRTRWCPADTPDDGNQLQALEGRSNDSKAPRLCALMPVLGRLLRRG